jgi:aminoglycoside phosphotransferase family enzyme
MERFEIEQLLAADIFHNQKEKPGVAETHISWVILAEKHAYKIKKPVKFSFLDFSSLEKRKYYCEREVQLNKRLAGDMYLGVIPVFKINNTVSFTNGNGNIVDYAVLMKRMDSTLEMDKLLIENRVNADSIDKLAVKIAVFHQHAAVISKQSGIDQQKARFNDIQAVQEQVDKYCRADFSGLIEQAIEKSNQYLEKNSDYFEKRSLTGFIKDGHGDLHAGNIFLYNDPVIFDCIEFNDEMRKVDILDEIAFLCMDLEYYGQTGFSARLYREYHQCAGITENDDSRLLFHYYKCYRANIRAKIKLINIDREKRTAAIVTKESAEGYLSLLKKYLTEF